MNIKKLSLLVLFVLTVGLLSACSTPKEDPEQVMNKFKSAMTEIQSGDLTVDLAMQGADAQDNLDFTGKLDLKFDRENEEERKADVALTVSGSMQTAERSLSGNVELAFRTLGNQFYLQLKKLEADDPSLQSIAPIVKLYEGKWLKLSEDLIPENVRKLQEKDEATLANSLVGVGAELRLSAVALYGLNLYGRVGYAFAVVGDGIAPGAIEGLYFQAGSSF